MNLLKHVAYVAMAIQLSALTSYADPLPDSLNYPLYKAQYDAAKAESDDKRAIADEALSQLESIRTDISQTIDNIIISQDFNLKFQALKVTSDNFKWTSDHGAPLLIAI